MSVFGDPNQRMIDLFAQRFEEADGRVVFRKNLRAAGILVSPDERDRFVATFRRQLKRLYWGFMATLLFAVGASVFAFVRVYDEGTEPPASLIYVPITLFGLIFVGAQLWCYYEPNRALDGRIGVGDSRSKEEAKRLALARISWPQLGVALLALAYGLWRLWLRFDLTKGWALLVWPAFALITAMAARTAWRKWRMERRA